MILCNKRRSFSFICGENTYPSVFTRLNVCKSSDFVLTVYRIRRRLTETLRDVIPTVEMISILTLLFNSVEQVKVRSGSDYLSVSLLFCFVYFQRGKEEKGECTRVGTGYREGRGPVAGHRV